MNIKKKPEDIAIIDINISDVQNYLRVCTLVDLYDFLSDLKELRKKIGLEKVLERGKKTDMWVVNRMMKNTLNPYTLLYETCKYLAVKNQRLPFMKTVVWAALLNGNVIDDDVSLCSYEIYHPNIEKLSYDYKYPTLALFMSPDATEAEINRYIKKEKTLRDNLQRNIDAGSIGVLVEKPKDWYYKTKPSHGLSLESLILHRKLYWEHIKGKWGSGYTALAGRYKREVSTVISGIDSYTKRLYPHSKTK
jgi:hypothetical protein